MADVSATIPAGPVTEAAPTRNLALAFHGRTADYFRLWAVNLCLTLVTLGIFSAWAKVRKKRYFYSHTTLDGTPFQYLGQPIPILKGRLIAALLFVLYYLSDNFFTAFLPYVMALGVVLAPWVVVRAASFNTRYSAYRNMTFGFDANYWSAFKTLYWLGVIPLFAAGSAFAWWGNLYLGAGVTAVLGLLFPWWLSRFKNFIVSNTLFGGVHGIYGATGRQFFNIYIASGLIVVLAGVVTGALFAGLFSSLGKSKHAFWIAAVPIYAGYVLAFAYVNARSGNLVWNNIRLGPMRFLSTLSSSGLMKLYIGNALAIVASLGLLIPWAVMRTFRYRIDHMQVVQDGTLSAFRGSDTHTVGAAGGEMSELFDIDLSL